MYLAADFNQSTLIKMMTTLKGIHIIPKDSVTPI